MFDKAIIDTDKFADMPMSTKGLYFLLGMEADDRGFVSPRRVMRMHGGSEDDLKILAAKQYILYFESGVIVITDFNKNNYLDINRIKETEFIDELRTLELVDKKYRFSTGFPQVNNKLVENCTQASEQVLNKCSTSIEENSIEENSNKRKTSSRFSAPSVDEVKKYCDERNNLVDPQTFVDFYESKGWMIGSSKMKSWQAAVRTWEKKEGFRARDKPVDIKPAEYQEWMPSHLKDKTPEEIGEWKASVHAM